MLFKNYSSKNFQLSSNGKEFKLQTTDKKKIPVVMNEPFGEYIDNLIQIRGRFDGRRIEAESYSQFLPEMTEDFGEITNKNANKINL